jgi:hypothetical protein
MKKVRPLGKITEDMEKLLFELVDDHELQRGEILAIISVWMEIHAPYCIEVYMDGTSPEFKYGSRK